jgi:acetyl-CoA synthetase
VCRLANVLKTHGVKKGDSVCIYMPMTPYVVYSMLACARIGAVHSVVFAGFSAEALHARIVAAQSKVVITADEVRDSACAWDLVSVRDSACAWDLVSVRDSACAWDLVSVRDSA